MWWYVGQGKPVTDENCQIVHRTAMVSAQAGYRTFASFISLENHTESSGKRVFLQYVPFERTASFVQFYVLNHVLYCTMISLLSAANIKIDPEL